MSVKKAFGREEIATNKLERRSIKAICFIAQSHCSKEEYWWQCHPYREVSTTTAASSLIQKHLCQT